MIHIPIIVTRPAQEPETCPSCGKEEEVKVVCTHCGHEYEEEEGSRSLFWAVANPLIVVCLFFLALTFCIWATEHNSKYNPYTGSYVKYLGGLFKAFWGLIKDVV